MFGTCEELGGTGRVLPYQSEILVGHVLPVVLVLLGVRINNFRSSHWAKILQSMDGRHWTKWSVMFVCWRDRWLLAGRFTLELRRLPQQYRWGCYAPVETVTKARGATIPLGLCERHGSCDNTQQHWWSARTFCGPHSQTFDHAVLCSLKKEKNKISVIISPKFAFHPPCTSHVNSHMRAVLHTS